MLKDFSLDIFLKQNEINNVFSSLLSLIVCLFSCKKRADFDIINTKSITIHLIQA